VVTSLSDAEQEFLLIGTKFLGDYTDAFTKDRISLLADAKMKLKAWGYRVLIE